MGLISLTWVFFHNLSSPPMGGSWRKYENTIFMQRPGVLETSLVIFTNILPGDHATGKHMWYFLMITKDHMCI